MNDVEFKMTRDGKSADATPPANKALVYVIELMPSEGFLTTHVRIGVDGAWLAQLSAQSSISFALDPGVHHLCARYEGKVAASEVEPVLLHSLDVKSGKIYYVLYRGFITRDAGEIGLFDVADEDEGRYALQIADHLSATVVKK